MRQKKSASILRKFLLFNLGVFSILGLLTLVYLKAIQPNLVKKRAGSHYIIINNTIDHLQRLNINFNSEDIKTFLLSTRFLFQSLDRVQLRKKTNVVDDTKNIITHGKLKLDPSQLECEWGGKPLPDKLTTTEFLIVKELAKRPGVIKERAHLMDIAYKENTEIEDRTIDSHVKRIRKKFKKVDEKFSAIETRYGSGYRWNVS